MNQMPEHVKEKILMFFLKTSVPRIIEEERKKKREYINKENHIAGNDTAFG